MTKTFCQKLVEAYESRPEKTAMQIVGISDEVYTFGEMLRQIRAVAYRIREEGVKFGERIALIGENHPCWAIAYLAIIYRGAVVVPIDPQGEIETVSNFLENSDAKLAFLSPGQVEKFRHIEEKIGRCVPSVVWRAKSTNGFHSFEDWADTEFPESFAKEIPPAKEDDNALLIYTSGTTGLPKGVPLTHGNIVAELEGINQVIKLTDKEKVLSLLPLFHAYLQIVNLWIATIYGCEVGYLKELTPDELSKAMKEFRPTVLTTVPRLWYLFHKKIFDAVATKSKPAQIAFRAMLAANGFLRNNFKINLGKKFFAPIHEGFGGNLRLAVSAGSRFDAGVAKDFHKIGFTILQAYGLTETSGAATATYENDNRVGSVGKKLFNAQVKIDTPDADGVGEVLIKGPMVFKGYYKNPIATAEAFTEDGWFRSGDLGRFDADGNLYIVGRKKDVIILPNGKNVHPEDLEVHYLKSPLVEELAVIGLEDKSLGKTGAEKLVAVVVPDFGYLKREKIANSQTAIRFELDNLGRELPEYQRVREYIFRTEPLPRTATRKIKRFQLQKEISTEKSLTAGEKTVKKFLKFNDKEKRLLASDIGQKVLAVIKSQNPGIQTIHPEMNLEIDLRLDSLARAEVFVALEQAFSISFQAEMAAQALSVRDVIELTDKIIKDEDKDRLKTEIEKEKTPNWSEIISRADEKIPELGAVLRNRPIFSPVAFLVFKFVNLFWKIFTRLEVEDIENLKKLEKPFLICPNHQSFLDPFVLCTVYPYDVFKDVFHVGASEFFEGRLMSRIAKMIRVVPINPDAQLMRAMKAGAIGLKKGKILNIYPEGERAFDGDLHEFKKGAAILATELDLPILPVALDGVYKVWARKSWKIRPAKVKIKFGKPFYAKEIIKSELSENNNLLTGRQKYEFVTIYLKNEIAQMLDEMRRQ
jgi:long-chain acyl-CoA synthetase